MRIEKSSRLKGVFIILTMGLFFCALGARSLATITDSGPESRADVIVIDSLKTFGELERGGVTFLHTKHTAAMEEKGQDCTACHTAKDGRLVSKFKRTSDDSREQVMNVYHDNCISCHEETAAAGDKSGPVSCGECHTLETKAVSNREPVEFDKSLHFRHAKAMDNKCGQCHHEYDDQAKKLIYVEGKEGSCQYCHKEMTEENRISLREASHAACIDCHSDRLAQSKDAGPVSCVACHDPEAQKAVEKVADVPRMKRNQPDVVLVRAGGNVAGGITVESMNPVPFDHKAHEQYNDSCKVCHHADLTACNTCHTTTGSEKGDFIKLERAMHQVGNKVSCIGCHTQQQQAAECAGCHSAIVKSAKQQEAYCGTCHTTPLPDAPLPATPADKAYDAAYAARLLARRTPVTMTYPDEEIPEKVVMKQLEDQYKPAEMPHRKIVKTLMKNMADNPLATNFHKDPGTVCQGCHHNSPPSNKPPLCASCHGKPFDNTNLLKPGLSGAYHLQCMNCHEKMGIEKPDSRDCNACHEKKA